MLFAIELIPIVDESGSGDAAPASLEHAALLQLEPDLVFVAEPPGVDNAAAVRDLHRRVPGAVVPHVTTRNRNQADAAERVGTWRGMARQLRWLARLAGRAER